MYYNVSSGQEKKADFLDDPGGYAAWIIQKTFTA
jgi:hypothetical protein